MTNQELIAIGFKEVSTFTVMNSVYFDLGRGRQLLIGDLSTPNEMMYLCEVDDKDPRKITDLVCIHNYDYDGYLTLEKVKDLINILTKSNK